MARLRWWEFVPEGLLSAGLGVFLVTEFDAATSAFKSTTALVLMAATGLGWLAVRFGSLRLPPRWAPLRTGAFAVAAAAVLAVVVLPAYDDTTVVETLPVDNVTMATTTTTMAAAAADAPSTTTLTPAAVAPRSRPTTTTAPAAASPVALATGAIRGIDHRASGTVRVYAQPSGAQTVGLEGIDIQPGPDYDVYLVPGADQDDLGGSIRLGDLRGNKGTLYYEVPAGTTLTPGDWTVLVWCETFDVPVAGATPA